MIQYKVFKEKEDWANFRAGYFTSSETSRLLSDPKLKSNKESGNLSDSAMTYIIERTAQVLAPREPEFYNSKMERGNELEPQAVVAFAENFGLNVNSDDFIYTSVGGFVFFWDDDYNAGGTPDIILNGHDAIVEIKCPDSKQHLRYMLFKSVEDFIKTCPDYYNQIQQNIWLCNKQRGYFVSFDDRFYSTNHHMFVLEIPRNEAHIELLKSKLLKAKTVKDTILTSM